MFLFLFVFFLLWSDLAMFFMIFHYLFTLFYVIILKYNIRIINIQVYLFLWILICKYKLYLISKIIKKNKEN